MLLKESDNNFSITHPKEHSIEVSNLPSGVYKISKRPRFLSIEMYFEKITPKIDKLVKINGGVFE